MSTETKIYPHKNFKGEPSEDLAKMLAGKEYDGAAIVTFEQPYRGPFIDPVTAFALPGVGKVVRIRTNGKSVDQPPLFTPAGIPNARQYLEEDGPLSESFVWAANSAYWESFMDFEAVKKKSFESSLPSGDSDGVNPRFWSDFLGKFVTHITDGLGENCPERINAVEIGAGSGRQAHAFLATLRHVANLRQRPEIFEKVRYGIHDSAQEVLDDARVHTGEFSDKVSLTKNGSTLSERNVMLFMASNLLDNLPFDQYAYVKEQGFFGINSRLYITRGDWVPFSGLEKGITPESLFGKIIRAKDARDVIDKNDPEATEKGVQVWQDFYNKLRFEQSAVAVSAEKRIGAIKLSDLNVESADFMIFNASPAVARLQSEVMRSLHPQGAAVFLDIFRRSVQFMDSNPGPTKLDGSVYGWVNLDQVEALSKRFGAVTVDTSFKSYNPKSNGSIVITGPLSGVAALV
jgi:hypothetical protein